MNIIITDYWYPVGSGYTRSPKIHSVNLTSRTPAPQILQKLFSFNCSWGNLRSGSPSWGSLGGRRSKGKGKGIRARDLARGRRGEGNAYKALIKKVTKITQLWMTSCQTSLAAMHVFKSYFSHCFSFVFLKQEIQIKGTIKKVQMRSSIEGIFLEICNDTCRVTSNPG